MIIFFKRLSKLTIQNENITLYFFKNIYKNLKN
jgi:hypothetical protein